MNKGEETPNAGENNEKKEQVVLSNEQMMNVIKDLQETVAKLQKTNQPIATQTKEGMSLDDITKVIQASVNTRDRDLNYEGGIKEEDIPVDDFIDEGIRFCAPSGGYVIVDDRRKGHRVLIPYNKPHIFFEYEATRRVQQGKYETIAPYSVYISKSKKEAEWLRNHSHYNVLFYESATDAVSADVIRMQKLARMMTLLQHYSLPDLIKRCREYSIAPSEEPSKMRSQLAHAMVDIEIQSALSTTEKLLHETNKTALLVGKGD